MILIVGSVYPGTSKYYLKLDLAPSELYIGQQVEYNNVYHTSLADCKDLANHLHKFQKIYWAQSKRKEFKNFKEYFETIYILKTHGGVIGLDNDPYSLKSLPIVNNSIDNIVFFGCSHTYGGYLLDSDDEYTNIVSKYFGLKPLNLSLPGQGNFRSFELFDQIDFFQNQIVVLQLTDFARLRYFSDDGPDTQVKEDPLHQINQRSYLEVFNDKQLMSMTFSRLHSILKFTRALKLKFVFFNTDNFANDYNAKIIEFYLRDFPEYIPNLYEKNGREITNLYYDEQYHKLLSKKIINKIENLYQ